MVWVDRSRGVFGWDHSSQNRVYVYFLVAHALGSEFKCTTSLLSWDPGILGVCSTYEDSSAEDLSQYHDILIRRVGGGTYGLPYQ